MNTSQIHGQADRTGPPDPKSGRKNTETARALQSMLSVAQEALEVEAARAADLATALAHVRTSAVAVGLLMGTMSVSQLKAEAMLISLAQAQNATDWETSERLISEHAAVWTKRGRSPSAA